ncbi:StbB family protein (plasmid) [Pseudomonas orientalis]|uniref:StbB family protein n=1 Tax=Pseudomonas orientalis TaxID=76758 RepID=UPI003985D48B
MSVIYKKIVVVNYTGTMGKTTLTAFLLSPRMPGAPIIAVESINETAETLGLGVEKFRGDQFRDVFQRLMLEDHAIVDVGASNVEDFMASLEDFEEAHEEIDFYVIPVTPGTKEQQETMAMINSLAALGIPPTKIRVVFNRVKRDVSSEFSIIKAYHAASKTFWINDACAVFETELFSALAIKRLSLQKLMSDDVDYKTLLKNKEASAEERAAWSDMYGLRLLCNGVNRKLDYVFSTLISEGDNN